MEDSHQPRLITGAPGAIPTRDLPLRRRTLYAAELREHKDCIVNDVAGNLKPTSAKVDDQTRVLLNQLKPTGSTTVGVCLSPPERSHTYKTARHQQYRPSPAGVPSLRQRLPGVPDTSECRRVVAMIVRQPCAIHRTKIMAQRNFF